MNALSRKLDDLGVNGTDYRSSMDAPQESSRRAAFGSTFDAPSDSFKMPDLRHDRLVRAIASKNAGRLNAAAIPDAEYTSLLDERSALVDKLLSETITPREENRLAYVRWSLDRIEDARYGADIDALQHMASVYQKFTSDVIRLRKDLEQARKRKRK